MSGQKCAICKSELTFELGKDDVPICGKKDCVKKFTKIFGDFCRAVSEKAGMDTEGFLFKGKLIRYTHFEEDFEKIWEEVEK